MNKLKVVFCGTPQIGATILETLTLMNNVEIVLVISQPDRIIGKKKQLTSTPVKEVAIRNNLDIIQPVKIGDDYEIIKSKNPDFIITCAYGQFIPTKILSIPKIDSINLHGSLLPKYRGGAPIQYAIWNGDDKTGISIMKMIKEMDAGDYFIQKSIPITDEDNTGTIFEKLAILGSEMIKENLQKIANNELPLIKQNNLEVTLSKNISATEEMINWSRTNREVFNQIRALQPWPIPHTFINNERYKIGKTRMVSPDEIFPMTLMIHQPGEIVFLDSEGIIIQTGQGFVKVLEIQRPGKSMNSAGLIMTGQFIDLHIGTKFKDV